MLSVPLWVLYSWREFPASYKASMLIPIKAVLETALCYPSLSVSCLEGCGKGLKLLHLDTLGTREGDGVAIGGFGGTPEV